MRGSREQFIKQAMDEYQSALIHYAVSIVHNHALAHDIVQDSYIRLCQQDPDQFPNGVKSWLFTVCRNRALDLLRKEKHSILLEEDEWSAIPSDDAQPDQELQKNERYERMYRLLQQLSDNQREVIILKFQQGLSYKEIHQITGLSISNVGFLIYEGLRRLRGHIPDELRN